MHKKYVYLASVFYGFFLLFPAFAERETNSYLAISDIHFNPFEICSDKYLRKQCEPYLLELKNSDISNWNAILQKYNQGKPIAPLGQNTNFALFQSFLGELARVTKNNNISFVVILGDFLGHEYIENFKQYSGDSSNKGLTLFLKKTYQYIAHEIRASLPEGMEIYPVIGNNDSYIDDYNVDNSKVTEFYSDLYEIWGKATPKLQTPEFKNGGYYSISSSIKGLKIIALNTNSFSRIAISKDKLDINKFNREQLNWFSKRLSEDISQKVLIISHIPPGIDAYASKRAYTKGLEAVPFWNKNEDLVLKPYIKILRDNFSSLAGIMVGHTHYDGFQILDNDLGIYTLSAPSISPVHYNNSGFKIVYLDENNTIKNYTTYFLERTNDKAEWKAEYDFNNTYESQNVFLGLQSLVGKWFRNPIEGDKRFANFLTLGANSSSIMNNWKFYMCSANDNLTIQDYAECIESAR